MQNNPLGQEVSFKTSVRSMVNNNSWCEKTLHAWCPKEIVRYVTTAQVFFAGKQFIDSAVQNQDNRTKHMNKKCWKTEPYYIGIPILSWLPVAFLLDQNFASPQHPPHKTIGDVKRDPEKQPRLVSNQTIEERNIFHPFCVRFVLWWRKIQSSYARAEASDVCFLPRQDAWEQTTFWQRGLGG